MKISRHWKISKDHARVQKNVLEELQAYSLRLVHGIRVGEVVTNWTGGMIIRKVFQARLKYLDVILRITGV